MLEADFFDVVADVRNETVRNAGRGPVLGAADDVRVETSSRPSPCAATGTYLQCRTQAAAAGLAHDELNASLRSRRRSPGRIADVVDAWFNHEASEGVGR